jgi:hypothetical protein
MIVSSCRPYFAPYPGFFSKAAHSDVFVLLDEVQFPRGTTWLTRNRFKNDQGVLWMTIPVWKKGLGLQRIRDVTICYDRPWHRKHLESFRCAYAKAPFFEDHLPFLERVYRTGHKKLAEFNLEIIRYLMTHLGIAPEILLLSELGIESKEPQLSVDVCKKLGGSTFLAQGGAEKYLDAHRFRKEGISLEFLSHRPLVYPQLWGEFTFNLSALDLLFTCGPKAGPILCSRP